MSSSSDNKTVEALKGQTYVDSPKGAGHKTKEKDAPNKKVMKIRRRLSVVGDNLVDGVSEMMGELSAEEEDAIGSVPAGGLIKLFHAKSKKGYASYNPKKVNQDSMICPKDMKSSSTTANPFVVNGVEYIVVAVFDGHGEQGHFVSRHISQKFAGNVRDQITKGKTPNEAQEIAYDIVEKEVIKNPSIDTKFSGTTATSCVLKQTDDGWEIHAANIGDSRAILAVGDMDSPWKAQDITIDHKPDLPEEKKRIVAKGGRVFAVQYDDGCDGPARVWLATADLPGLAMSRSLGDGVAHTVGVSSKPECFKLDLERKHRAMILASDGLWEFLESQDVVDMIYDIHSKSGGKAYAADFAEKSVNALMKKSHTLWMEEERVVDDTTIVMLVF